MPSDRRGRRGANKTRTTRVQGNVKRNNRPGRFPALSLVTAAMLVAVAACASPVRPGADLTPAGSGSPGSAERPADPGVKAAAEGPAQAATGGRARRISRERARITEAEPGQAAGVPAGAAGTAAGTEGLSAGKAVPGRCRTGRLRARVGEVDAGAGQRYAPLVLTNASERTCWVYGFVGLVMFDRNGDALRTRVRRESVPSRRVTLRPGVSAHARLHWTVVPGRRESTCPSAARLMIIPPDAIAHLEVPFTSEVCGDGRLSITPMAPGSRL